MTAYEYRAIGVVAGRWRLTEWSDRETALEDYETAGDEWTGVALERREPDDDATLQRKPRPDAEWSDVTDDMTTVKPAEGGA